MGKKDTTERDARIWARWGKTGSVAAAARASLVHWDVAARVIRARGGEITKHNCSLPDSPERDQETLALRAAGMSWRSIAERVYLNRNVEGRLSKRWRDAEKAARAAAAAQAPPSPPTRRDYGHDPLPPMHPFAVSVLREAGAWV